MMARSWILASAVLVRDEAVFGPFWPNYVRSQCLPDLGQRPCATVPGSTTSARRNEEEPLTREGAAAPASHERLRPVRRARSPALPSEQRCDEQALRDLA